jgi:hypothetical protein
LASRSPARPSASSFWERKTKEEEEETSLEQEVVRGHKEPVVEVEEGEEEEKEAEEEDVERLAQLATPGALLLSSLGPRCWEEDEGKEEEEDDGDEDGGGSRMSEASMER